jgi:hypothetical protein
MNITITEGAIMNLRRRELLGSSVVLLAGDIGTGAADAQGLTPSAEGTSYGAASTGDWSLPAGLPALPLACPTGNEKRARHASHADDPSPTYLFSMVPKEFRMEGTPSLWKIDLDY